MIDYPWNNVCIARGVFSALACRRLTHLTRAAAWQPGRSGRGYQKCDILGATSNGGFLVQAADTLRALLGWPAVGVEDFWLLRFPKGSEVDQHVDPPDFPGEHWRANALIQTAARGRGGDFECEIEITSGQPKVYCAPAVHLGDVLIFRPDIVPHRMTHVLEGEKLELSMGTIIQ